MRLGLFGVPVGVKKTLIHGSCLIDRQSPPHPPTSMLSLWVVGSAVRKNTHFCRRGASRFANIERGGHGGQDAGNSTDGRMSVFYTPTGIENAFWRKSTRHAHVFEFSAIRANRGQDAGNSTDGRMSVLSSSPVRVNL